MEPPTEMVASQSQVSDWIKLIAFWGVLLVVRFFMKSDITASVVIWRVQREVKSPLCVGPIVFRINFSDSLQIRSDLLPSWNRFRRATMLWDDAAIIPMLAFPPATTSAGRVDSLAFGTAVPGVFVRTLLTRGSSWCCQGRH